MINNVFADIVHQRRAVRIYDTDQTLDSARVHHCIGLATLAPSSTNLQLWAFHHITDKSTLSALSEACFGQNAVKTAQEMVVFVVRRDLWRMWVAWNLKVAARFLKQQNHERTQARLRQLNTYYTRMIPFVYGDFLGLLGYLKKALTNIIGLFRPVCRQVSRADIRIVANKSCALATQTFMLGMSAEGYDTCPLEGFDSRRVQKTPNLPRQTEINMIVSCGICGEKGIYPERCRLPFNEVYAHH